MIKPIFIIGLPRTGSTLWSNVIEKDVSVMRFGEMHFYNPWHRDVRTLLRSLKINLCKDEDVMRFLDSLFSPDTYTKMHGNYWEQINGIEPETLKLNIYVSFIHSDRSIGQLFRAIVDESTIIRGYKRCLVKFPVAVSQLHYLLKWYPESKIVHITRDPRATALSKTSDPGGIAVKIPANSIFRALVRKAMLLFVSLQFNQSVAVHRKHLGNMNYALFSYEELVRDPENVIKRLCNFAEMEYTDEMMYPNKGQPSSVTGKMKDGFNKVSLYYWKKKLSSFEIWLVTVLTGRGMKFMGYEPKA